MIKINGVKIDIDEINNIEIDDKVITINNSRLKLKDFTEDYVVNIQINGDVKGNLKTNGNVTVNNNVGGDIDTNGHVQVLKGDVKGDIDTNGNVTVNGNVYGDIDTNGTVIIKNNLKE